MDQEFVELTMPYVKVLIIALLPIGLILDLLTWRRRKIGNLIVYYEVLSNLVQAFVPFDFGNFELLVILQTYLMVYLICVCKTGQSVIACTVGIAVTEFCISPLMYNYEGGMWSIGRLLSILQIVLVAFIFLTGVAQIITYIVRIHGKMAYLILENLNLLNKMHEGLIVVEEDSNDLEMKIASLPAIRLLKQMPKTSSSIDASLDQSSKLKLSQADLNRPLFTPTTLYLKASPAISTETPQTQSQ